MPHGQGKNAVNETADKGGLKEPARCVKSLLFVNCQVGSAPDLRQYHRMENEWSHCYKFWCVRLIDGRKAWGLLMRRETPSGYEYRLPTEAEQADYVSREAW